MIRTNTGAAAAWVDTVEAFGSGRLRVAEVLEPAIRLATEGYKQVCFCLHRASLIS
jgi:gamma-glutamyltranspeptidase